MSRNRNVNATKRMKASASQTNSFVKILNKRFDDNSKCYHSVIVLTHKQWRRLKSNAVILSNIVVDKSPKSQQTTIFNNVIYSNNVKKYLKRCKCTSNQRIIHWKRPHMNNFGYVLIVTLKDKLKKMNSDLVVINGGNVANEASGYVVLCLCHVRKETNISEYI